MEKSEILKSVQLQTLQKRIKQEVVENNGSSSEESVSHKYQSILAFALLINLFLLTLAKFNKHSAL